MVKQLSFTALENLTADNGILTIRRYRETDFDNLNRQFTPDNFEWYFTHYNNCSEYVSEKLAAYQKQETILYVIIENATQNIVGVSCLYEISYTHRRVEMGSTWFGKTYQGKFYNAMSKLLFLNYLFKVLQFNRVQWKTDGLNVKSQAAMRKLGFHQDGILRKHAITYGGRVRDSVVFSVIKDEWDTTKLIIEERIRNKLAQSS